MGKVWGGRTGRLQWAQAIANDQTWLPRHAEPEATIPTPQPGDIVLKPYFDRTSLKQLFRVETWNTHALLEGPFPQIRQALDAAVEMGVTVRVAVWVDYSDDPNTHELEDAPVYFADHWGSEEPL